MNVQHTSGETNGKFYIEKEGEEVAFLTYSMAGAKRMIIRYTEVIPELRGGSIGKQLVKEAAGYARENNLRVTPLCYFVKLVMERDDSLQDVLSYRVDL